MVIQNYSKSLVNSVEPKYIYVKDAVDFLANYYPDEEKGIPGFAEMVQYRVVNDKVHIKILAPIYTSEVKELLKNIKE